LHFVLKPARGQGWNSQSNFSQTVCWIFASAENVIFLEFAKMIKVILQAKII